MNVEWRESPIYDEAFEVRQVYSFIMNGQNKVLLQNDRGRFNLPGGKPEREETYIETLCRECMEESQVSITDPELLGYLIVTEDENFNSVPYVQLRYVSKLLALYPIDTDPATGRIYGREFVDISSVNRLLGWGDHGERQIGSLRRFLAESFFL